ncbi:MAG: glycosyl hydrolase-related protein [Clostridiales bacterium]|nr:glycosyl hydrolase-related protein [Clostridiales bacterium]
MKNLDKLDLLARQYGCDAPEKEERAEPEWGRRAVLELLYAVQLSVAFDHDSDDLVDEAIGQLWQAVQAEGAITRTACLAMETQLAGLAERAKSFTQICIGHAHIDMNWMWSFDETVSITLDTCRTMLDLMDQYPDYTFAQSQASVYEIVARHDPALLERIRDRVQEGRWEVTASTWVEADRNLPNAESMVRHLLYTRRYLAGLLEIDPDSLDLDFEPDTFGHHQNVPEILSDAGVRYYYHCRGSKNLGLTRWQAPSGRSVLVFQEPLWYNWDIDGRCALMVPTFCRPLGLTSALRVYGVGDHGGGPTRRDLERIRAMDRWPIFPHYRFGTFHDFFREAEKIQDRLPVTTGERNFIFDGCYTTQTRIKRGNRLSEQALLESEAAAALAQVDGAFESAWRKVLFNQFHDILPGSGTAETREYAMAGYQEALALANTGRMNALRSLADRIDTTGVSREEDIRLTRAEGAGVGFPTGLGQLPRTARHSGHHRLFMVWNPLPFDRTELCELTLWDWPGDSGRLSVCDGDGRPLACQVLEQGRHPYWGHRYVTALAEVTVPAMGYATLVVDEAPAEPVSVSFKDPRQISPSRRILENEHLRVVLSEVDASVVSLLDKKTGCDLADPANPSLLFRLVREDASRGMTAWVVGAWQQIASLHQNVRFVRQENGPLRRSICWETRFGAGSTLQVTLSLDKGSCLLRLDADVRWQEIGSREDGLPQLQLFVSLNNPASFRYDIPMGEIERPPLPHDVPASRYALAPDANGRALLLVSDSKHGFRGLPDGLALNLIRSSVDPDPWPEIGHHTIRLGLALTNDSGDEPGQMADRFCQALQALPLPQAQHGSWPLSQSLFRLSGSAVRLVALKTAEDGDGLIVRLASLSDQPETAELTFWQPPARAAAQNLLEEALPDDLPVLIDGRTVRFQLAPRRLQTLRISW